MAKRKKALGAEPSTHGLQGLKGYNGALYHFQKARGSSCEEAFDHITAGESLFGSGNAHRRSMEPGSEQEDLRDWEGKAVSELRRAEDDFKQRCLRNPRVAMEDYAEADSCTVYVPDGAVGVRWSVSGRMVGRMWGRPLEHGGFIGHPKKVPCRAELVEYRSTAGEWVDISDQLRD